MMVGKMTLNYQSDMDKAQVALEHLRKQIELKDKEIAELKEKLGD